MEGFTTTVTKEAEKTGDAAGKTLGARMAATLKANAGKALGVGFGVTIAAGAAIAGKGLLELQGITADFAAETGASAEEADKAGKAINAMAGRNIQPLAEVGAALTKVHTDLGLTGEEAEKTTEQFLKFARATKQNAASAVTAFDDILDAWGLTAQDAQGIMDKLIVSHQRYGGSIEENQRSLAALAPALQAANLKVDDGIGLLNLFETSGVDSAAAVAGLRVALTKVKSPEELKTLVDDIIATEDPFLRAQKASDLFGAKAGAKLANALKPGTKGLEDFQISQEDATGATLEAAEALDSTPFVRFQLGIKAAGAALIGFGSNFGPALTGLASFASLAGGLGGGKLVAGILLPFAGLGKKLAVRLAAAVGISFASSAVSGAASAGGEAIANMSTKAIQQRLAGKAATDVLAKGLSEGLIGVESSSLVKSATSRLGSFMGSTLGKALSVGFAAVAVVELVKTYNDVADAIKSQTADLATKTGDFTKQATLEALRNARKGVAEQLKAMGNDPIAEALGLSAKKGVEDTLGQLDREIAGRMAQVDHDAKFAAEGIGSSIDGLAPHFRELASQGGASFITVGDDARGMTQRILNGVDKIKAAVHGLATNLAAEARAMITGYYDPLILQDNLLATNAQIAGAKRVLASKKTTDAEKADARELLHSLGKTQADYILQLAEAGDTSSKAYKDGIKSLRDAIKKAKGPAKAALQEILDKILEVEKAGKVVPINVQVNQRGNIGVSGARAEGGPWRKGEISWVGEEGPELMEAGGDAFITPADVSKRAMARMKSPAGVVPVRPVRPGRSANPSVGAALADDVKAAAAAFVGVVVPPLRAAIVQLGTIKAPPAPPVTVNVVVKPSTPVVGQPLEPDASAPRLVATATAQKVQRVPGPGMPQSFARGGVVKGPPGQPVPIIAHGGEEVVAAKDRGKPDSISATLVKTITRTLSEVAHRVSDTTVVLRRIVENVERTVVQAGPTITVRKPGLPPLNVAPPAGVEPAATGFGDQRGAEPRRPGQGISRPVAPVAPPLAAKFVEVITREVSNTAREVVSSVSDTTVVLRELVEKISAQRQLTPAPARPVAVGPTITVKKPGVPGLPGLPALGPQIAQAVAPQPVASRAVAQAVQARAKQMREAMLPGPWMPAAAIADVGGSLRPPAPHVPSFRAPSIAPARVPSGLAAVPSGDGGSIREGDIHVNLLDKLEVRSVRDIGGGLRMLGEQGYLGPKGPGRRKG